MRAGVLYSPTGLVNTQCPYTANFKGDFKSYFKGDFNSYFITRKVQKLAVFPHDPLSFLGQTEP